jgi:cell wall assembly regulator SMI1
MTSYDRHASHDSPYRTGQHVPLSQSRHDTLTSIATSAAESRPDLSSAYEDDTSKAPLQSTSNGWATSPSHPYSPGMRSLTSQQRRRLSNDQQNPDDIGRGEIQMQSFHDGAPPPPPASHSWKNIEKWTENNYPELYDQLGEGCTQNDINELEHELDCSLPLEVRESLCIHDGQERGGLPTGIFFGCMLLDCEEIVQEWKNWRRVSDEYFNSASMVSETLPPPKVLSRGSSSASVPLSQQPANPLWRQELLDRQESQPPRAVQKAYAHPGWIPLARDWGGNNIAVDLAPGPAGKWGQVIIFGRDYDCKYVVARSWAAFLAMVADDFSSGKVDVDEDSGNMKLKIFKAQNVEPPYLEILRWRVDEKYGRRPTRRKPTNGLGLNTNLSRARDSPYGSPSPSEERGRSPHRFSSRGPNQSPKTFNVSSPLARVTEEAPATVSSSTEAEATNEPTNTEPDTKPPQDLLEMATPILPTPEPSETIEKEKLADREISKLKRESTPIKPSGSKANQETPTILDVDNADEMKTVSI